MLGRFTDNAHAVVRDSFSRGPTAEELDLLAAINARPRSLAARILAAAGVESDHIPADRVVLYRSTLMSQAIAVARRRGASYVGTEHVLLSVAQNPESSLSRLGVADRLDALLSTTEAEWKRAHPPLSRRLGVACRAVWRRLRG